MAGQLEEIRVTNVGECYGSIEKKWCYGRKIGFGKKAGLWYDDRVSTGRWGYDYDGQLKNMVGRGVIIRWWGYSGKKDRRVTEK